MSFQKLPETNSSEIIINPGELSNSLEQGNINEPNSESKSTSSETTERVRLKRSIRPPDRFEYTSFK